MTPQSRFLPSSPVGTCTAATMKPWASSSHAQRSRRHVTGSQLGVVRVELEPGETVRSASPERHLWGAVLAMLLDDARAYHKGARSRREELGAAYQDVMTCGPMLTRLCLICGHDPQWVAEGFRRWVKKNPTPGK